MASYKQIFGTNIEVLASDPANPVEGQVWYNSTDNVVKGFALTTAGAWATGGNLNTARSSLGGTGATKDAALAFGGGPPPAPTASALTESYNGTAWTEVSDLNSQRALIGSAGTYTSAIAGGGDQYSGTSESWNGTTWTNLSNSPNTGHTQKAAGADNTNALFFGGSPAAANNTTAYWNGSAWATLNPLNTVGQRGAGSGKTYTAALAIGGDNPSPGFLSIVESFNGTSWTEIADINTARRDMGGSGTQTSTLIFGGNTPPITAATEEWNGTSWTETTDLSTARNNLGQAGADNTNALAFGGGAPGDTAATEEWTGAGAPLTLTFTDS